MKKRPGGPHWVSAGSLSHCAQELVDLICVERLGVEAAADPFRQFFVVWVLRISYGFSEVLVPGYSSHVFRGTGVSSGQANWVANAFVGRKCLFYLQDVLPVVTEIVGVCEGCARARHHVVKSVLAFVSRLARFWVVFVRYTIVLALDDELVEVRICPSQRALHDSVELGERCVTSHLDAPPDGRLQVSERDFDLIWSSYTSM